MRHHQLMFSLVAGLTILLSIFSLATGVLVAQEQTLYGFGPAPDGNYPDSTPVLDRHGNLFGTAQSGGTFGAGIVYELSPSNGWTETIIYDFCQQAGCTDGKSPNGKLALDSKGNIYGTTFYGGAFGYGTIFELAKDRSGNWSETVLHSFGSGSDGATPEAGVVFDKAGNLFGTTIAGGTSYSCGDFYGCGVAFEMSYSDGAWVEQVLYNFCSQTNCADGYWPAGGLVLDKSHNLYGTTLNGGYLTGFGVVFELSANGDQWNYQVLHTFGGGDGANPFATLVLKGSALYGTTEFGGMNGNNGSVFELEHTKNGQWQEQVIYSFCSQFQCADGSQPLGGVTFDKSGNLYGTTFSGGSGEFALNGLVFKLTKPKKFKTTETVLHNFTGSDGFNPHVGVVLDKGGNVYGATFQGGPGGYGTVFEIISESARE